MRNMKRRIGTSSLRATWTTAVLSISALTALSTASHAQQAGAAPAEKVISIDLRDVRLESAVLALTNSTGLSNVVIQSIPGKSFQLVNVKLVDQTMNRALSAITASAGGIMTEQDGIYYIRPRTDADVSPTAKPEPAPEQNDSAKMAVSREANDAARQASRNRHWGKIMLTYILPSELVKYLDDPNYIAAIGKESDITDAWGPSNGNTQQKSPIERFSEPTPAPAHADAAATPSAPVPATPVTGSTGGLGGSAGRSDESYTQGQRGIGGAGQGGGGRQGGGLGGPGGGGGNQAASILPPGISNVISNDADNALLVAYDDVVDFDTLKKIVAYLDVAPKQVIIKAEFINVSISDADSFGINWHFQPAGNLDALIPAATGQTGTASILLAYSSGNAVANLQATLSHNTANVLQAPIITTVNNKPAFINVQTVVTVPETVVVAQNNGSPLTYTNQQPIQANNGINVLPHINGDGTISMFLQPQLQTASTTANGGYTTTLEQLRVYRRVASGETMVLGGFINKTDTVDLQKVPVLSDLPIIGNLFTQKSHTVVGSEILVFITATIIDDRAQGLTGIGGGGSPAPTP